MIPEDPYDDPRLLVNIFEREQQKLSPEERDRSEENFEAFCDWLLFDEEEY